MSKGPYAGPLEQVDACCYRIPKSYKPGHARRWPDLRQRAADGAIRKDQAPDQVANVAILARHSVGQPRHAGHPLGLRLLHRRRLRDRSGRGRRHFARRRRLRHQLRRPPDPHQPLLSRRQAAPAQLVEALFRTRADRRRPRRADTSSTTRKCSSCSAKGAQLSSSAATSASPRDLEHTEADGRIDGADPDAVSDHAVKRGAEQCGTLGIGQPLPGSAGRRSRLRRRGRQGVRPGKGSGLRHDPLAARAASAIRSATTPWRCFATRPAKYGIDLPDRQLACAPVDSPEGKQYIAAMRAAANFGFCNRQLLMQQAREVFARSLRPIVARTAA